MKTFFYTFLFIVASQLSTAQNLKITGVVSDLKGPLPGAAIVVKGTTNGTQADFDGAYTIMAKKGDVLVFSYVGYITEERKVKKSTIINVVLQEDAEPLEEIMVVAYGTSSRRTKKAVSGYTMPASAPARNQLYSKNGKKSDQKSTTKNKKDAKLLIVDGIEVD